MNPFDFLQGQRDCMEGNRHQSDMSEDYDRGFSIQVEWEAILDNMSEHMIIRRDKC